MRYVTVPEAIQLIEPRTREPVGKPKPFIDYAYEIWFNDPQANNGPASLRRWQNMVDIFEKYSKPGDVVQLEDEDWRALKTVIENSKTSYGALTMVQCIGFSEAVLNAPDKDPRGPIAAVAQAAAG